MQHSITKIEDDAYEKYSVIKPPSEFFGDNKRITRIVVDSRVRDANLFPYPNEYDVPFEDDINDVTSAQLIYVDVPFPNYQINKYFNKFIVTMGSVDFTITLDEGDYNDSQLLAEIQLKLDAALGAGVVTVSHTDKTDKYTFTSASQFTLKFINQTNTLAMLLGFSRIKNYNASWNGASFILTGEFKRNLNFNNYIIMDIEQFDILKSIDRDLNRSFAMIPKNYDTLNLADNPQYIKYFSPPIPKLTKLRVRLYDRFGNPYDFQNQDHRFEIELSSFKQRRKYGNIFSQ